MLSEPILQTLQHEWPVTQPNLVGR
jgi:hypothetical protein